MTDTVAATQTCRNCAAPLAGPYCAQCGQKDRPLDPGLWTLAGDAITETLNVDSKLLRSIRFLFTRPGFLTNELLAGRRASYVGPLRLYLLFSVLLFGAASVAANRALVVPPQGTTVDLGLGGSFTWDPDRPGDRERTMAQAQRAVSARTEWHPRALFVVMPILAVIVMILTWASRRGFPHHLHFTMHVQAVVFTALALQTLLPAVPPGPALAAWKEAPALVALRTAIGLAIPVYVFMSFRNVYGGGWFVNTLRTVVVGFLFVVMFLATGMIVFIYAMRSG